MRGTDLPRKTINAYSLEKLDNFFYQLTDLKQRAVYGQALKKIAVELQKGTRQKLTEKVGHNTTHYGLGMGRSGSKLTDGVDVKQTRSKLTTFVSIMNKKSPVSLWWFERGTNNRTTKKGWNRGALDKNKFAFFVPTQLEMLPRLGAKLDREIANAIVKIYQKNK